MKTTSKLLVSIALIVTMLASFFAGKYLSELENRNTRTARCSTLIGFAIDKAENEDLSDQGTMRALISNVYAAYQFCDDTKSASQLHDLWNFLVFEGDGNWESVKETVLIELNDALRAIKTSD